MSTVATMSATSSSKVPRIRYHELMPEPETQRQQAIYEVVRLAHLVYRNRVAQFKRIEDQVKLITEITKDMNRHDPPKMNILNYYESLRMVLKYIDMAKDVFDSAVRAYSECSGNFLGHLVNSPNHTWKMCQGATNLYETIQVQETGYDLHKSLWKTASLVATLPDHQQAVLFDSKFKPGTGPLVTLDDDVLDQVAEPSTQNITTRVIDFATDLVMDPDFVVSTCRVMDGVSFPIFIDLNSGMVCVFEKELGGVADLHITCYKVKGHPKRQIAAEDLRVYGVWDNDLQTVIVSESNDLLAYAKGLEISPYSVQ